METLKKKKMLFLAFTLLLGITVSFAQEGDLEDTETKKKEETTTTTTTTTIEPLKIDKKTEKEKNEELAKTEALIEKQDAKLNKKVTLKIRTIQVHAFLQWLQDQTGVNIIPEKDVKGTISGVSLENVPLRTVLDTVLPAYDLTWRYSNGIVVVGPRGQVKADGLATKDWTLQVADPVNVKNMLMPLLSEKGKIVIMKSGDINKIFITDQNSRFTGQFDRMIRDLDKKFERPKQVNIELKAVEMRISDAFETRTLIRIFNQLGKGIMNFSTNFGGGLINDGLHAADETFAVSFGGLGYQDLVAGLAMSAARDNFKMVVRPNITVQDGKKALIDITLTKRFIAYTTDTQGKTTAKLMSVPVPIKIEVTPEVTQRDRTIAMELSVEISDIVGGTGSTPETVSRKVRTDVYVRNNEILAVGGLIREVERKSITRIPLLGDIPILGALFAHINDAKFTTDLALIVRPSIVDQFPPVSRTIPTTDGIDALTAKVDRGGYRVIVDWSKDAPVDDIAIKEMRIFRSEAMIEGLEEQTLFGVRKRKPTFVCTPLQTTFVDDSAKPGAPVYKYRLEAYDASGELLGTIKNLRVSFFDKKNLVNLDWSADPMAKNQSVTDYKIYVNATEVKLKSKIKRGSTSYNDTSSLPGKKFYYLVIAVDEAGNEQTMSNVAVAEVKIYEVE